MANSKTPGELSNDWRSALGHTRLGPLPKTKNWNEVVESLTGSRFGSFSLPGAASRVGEIAALTLKAAKSTLAEAKTDAGVRYTFYLLTQIVSASRNPNWKHALAQHGISLSEASCPKHISYAMRLDMSADHLLRHGGSCESQKETFSSLPKIPRMRGWFPLGLPSAILCVFSPCTFRNAIITGFDILGCWPRV